jgi:serine/threonine protein kinase
MGTRCFKAVQAKPTVQNILETWVGEPLQPFQSPLQPFQSQPFQSQSEPTNYFYKQHQLLWKVHRSHSTYVHYNQIQALQGGDSFLVQPLHNVQLQHELYATSMERGQSDMFTLLETPFDWACVQRYLRHIVHSIHWLHAQNIAHRDLKFENIIVINKVVKLADFDYSSPLCQERDGGSHHYTPVHLTRETSHPSQRADNYAFGKMLCILFQRAIQHGHIHSSAIPFIPQLFNEEYAQPNYTHSLPQAWGYWADICLQCCAQLPPIQIPLIDTT